MTITGLGQVMCENRIAELLLERIYRMNPCIKFNILGDIISEKEALTLYYTVLSDCKYNHMGNMIYVPVVNCHEAKDFVASWDYTLMSISLPN